MRTNYSVKNSVTSFINNIINLIFLFIGQTVLIKVLGIEYAGLNGLFTNVLSFLNIFEFGIGSAVIYYFYKYIKKKDKESIKSLMNYYKKINNFITLLILLIGLILLPFLKYVIKDINIDINIYLAYFLFLLRCNKHIQVY